MAIYWTLCTAILCNSGALWCAAFKDKRLTSFPGRQRVLIFHLFMGPYPKVIKVYGNYPIYFNGNWMRNMASVVQCLKKQQKLCSKVIIASRWVSLSGCEAAGGNALIWPNSACHLFLYVGKSDTIWKQLIWIQPALWAVLLKWVANKKARKSLIQGISSAVCCGKCFYQ